MPKFKFSIRVHGSTEVIIEADTHEDAEEIMESGQWTAEDENWECFTTDGIAELGDGGKPIEK
jgi:hypothetical protein